MSAAVKKRANIDEHFPASIFRRSKSAAAKT
jgi:hypothetical protein